jgi:hypothetical protein
MIVWLVLKLEISYNRVIIISWRILGVFFLKRFFFWRVYFCKVKYLNFHNSSFCITMLFNNVNGEATKGDTPLVWSWIFSLVLSLSLSHTQEEILSLLLNRLLWPPKTSANENECGFRDAAAAALVSSTYGNLNQCVRQRINQWSCTKICLKTNSRQICTWRPSVRSLHG